MALISFNPPPGLNTEDTSFATPAWTNMSNVRFVEGKAQVIGGWTSLHTLPSSACVSMFAFLPVSGQSVQLVYGMNSGDKLYIGAGVATPTDRGIASIPASVPSWSFDTWGSELVACPSGGTLFRWAVGDATITEVAQAPDRITCILSTSERQILAFGCNEEVSGVFNGRCIRGSDLEDLADWTTSVSNNAFEHILGDPGEIVAAKKIGAYLAVFTTTGLHLGQFIGDPGQTYRFDKVAEGCGLASAPMLAIHNGTALWVTPLGQFCSWIPGALPVVSRIPLTGLFPQNWDQTTSFLTINRRFDEAWIHYGSAAFPESYVAVSLKDGKWFKGQMDRSAAFGNEVMDGVLTAAAYPYGAYLSANGANIYVQENGQTAAGASLNPTLTSGGQYIDNSQRRMMVRSFIPDFLDQMGDISLSFSIRDRPRSAPVTKGPYTITAGASKKDFRASGKIIAVTIESTAVNSYFRLGKPLFDVVPMGER